MFFGVARGFDEFNECLIGLIAKGKLQTSFITMWDDSKRREGCQTAGINVSEWVK